MQITVTTSSGETHEWDGALDALDDCGSLVVIYPLGEGESGDGLKTLTLRSQVDQGPDRAPLDVSSLARVAAVYAPGMWVWTEYA
jgi:hypothetical protein